MSDTPRTDAETLWADSTVGNFSYQCVPADFARQLERELAILFETSGIQERGLREHIAALEKELSEAKSVIAADNISLANLLGRISARG